MSWNNPTRGLQFFSKVTINQSFQEFCRSMPLTHIKHPNYLIPVCKAKQRPFDEWENLKTVSTSEWNFLGKNNAQRPEKKFKTKNQSPLLSRNYPTRSYQFLSNVTIKQNFLEFCASLKEKLDIKIRKHPESNNWVCTLFWRSSFA